MYLIAGIILLTGPSVWAIRIEPLIISLVLVYLTWCFSAALADGAHLVYSSENTVHGHCNACSSICTSL